MNPRNRWVIGLGSPHGDDRAAWNVIESLREKLEGDWMLRTASKPFELLDWVDGDSELVIVDACVTSDGKPRLMRADLFRQDLDQFNEEMVCTEHTRVEDGSWNVATLRACFCAEKVANCHQVGLFDALRLAATLNRLPDHWTLWAITGVHAQPDQGLSVSTERLIERCVDVMAKELTDARVCARS